MTTSENKLIETDPPMGVMLGLVWGFFWRSMLWGILFVIIMIIILVTMVFVTGAAASMSDIATKGLPAGIDLFFWVVYILGWVWICQKVFRQMLGKKFGGYRLVFLTPQAVATADSAVAKANDSALSMPVEPPPSV